MRRPPSSNGGTIISTARTNQVTPRIASNPIQNVKASSEALEQGQSATLPDGKDRGERCEREEQQRPRFGPSRPPLDDEAFERGVDEHHVVVPGQLEGIRRHEEAERPDHDQRERDTGTPLSPDQIDRSCSDDEDRCHHRRAVDVAPDDQDWECEENARAAALLMVDEEPHEAP